MVKPKIFIGSSTKGLKIARNISEHLDQDAECTPWNEGVFGLSDGTLESLTKVETDFAILVLTPDDLLEKKGDQKQAPRDNVIFECGFFMGKIGRERTFLVYDTSYTLSLPTDLAGITLATYSSERSDSNLYSAVGIACNKIRREIEKQKSIKRTMPINSKGINLLERGSIQHSDLLIDGSVVIQDDNSVLHNDLREAIFRNVIIPMKYLYCTDDGCEYWLDICGKPEYTFYTNSKSLLKQYSKELTEILYQNSGTYEFDVISLGTGNGVKDTMIIRDLLQRMQGDQILYYYPIEISAPMLIKSVKHLLSNCPKTNLKTKAILGDFNLIDKYKPIYEERENPNLISLLGNSIGNSDESSLLQAIHQSLNKGDFLLVEANTTKASLKDFCEDDINKRHDFSPLLSLGVKYEPEKIDYLIVENESQIANSKSVLGIYKSAFIGEKEFVDIKLSIVHHYDKNSFVKHFQESYGLRFLKLWTNNNATLFLFRRE